MINKVLYLSAISNHGCGKVAETFNRLYGDRETVSKSFVYDKVKKHQYQLKIIKRQIRSKPPRQVKINSTWGMDLTTVALNKKQHIILGIIDHGSRLNLKLSKLKSKHSVQILLQLTATFRQFGLPKNIRTDNEVCFNSKLICVALKLLGIKKQTTEVAAPWQNARIERFFGTFKQKIKFSSLNCDALQAELHLFNIYYNQLRTHENLNGLTPKEAWENKCDSRKGKPIYATAWNGVLSGYYFPD